MDGVTLTELKQIHHPKGDIFHGLKASDNNFCGFGEAYFSEIINGEIKGWKKHTKMTLNLIVPVGEVEFVIFDEKNKSFFSVILSPNNYKRLTINAGLWVAFKGHGEHNLLLNLASIEHDPSESVNCEIGCIEYEW